MITQSFESEVDIDFEGKTGKANIKWEVWIEYRKWGIKSISVFVPDQTVEAHLSYYDEKTAEEESQDLKMEIKDVECDDPISWGMICLHEIKCDKGDWTASF
jgi:hypothetical protein